ncbi:class I SAM-dependent methyltransferase [Argonema antarcticum]|uniref:class I SAM-dependent methyltransferase n=1 Tax=Argonema antarcticum TaxID=2942763 RepID=UPI002010EDA7|nr:class I SAM-dependent methyltransferase [Argonema antarcticum]MCL1471113.1 class I SAM-dependent methyltransferase [Argonema antarcticum A004/B2]
MPYSSGDFEPLLHNFVSQFQPSSIFDVGIGAGRLGTICRQAHPPAKIVGFEVWQPYVDQFKPNYEGVYNDIVVADFRDWIKQNSNWRSDLIVFGDVLEHFFYSQVHDCLQFCQYRSKHIIIIWPTEYSQDEAFGNLEESHRCNFRLRDLIDYDIEFYQKMAIEQNSTLHMVVIKGLI